MRRFCRIILAVTLSIASIVAGLADPAPPAGVPTEDGMRALALQWFAQMQAGKIDRTQYIDRCRGTGDLAPTQRVRGVADPR